MVCDLNKKAQQLEKKFRNLRNRGEVADRDLEDARLVVGIVRDLCRRLDGSPVDLDSRAERAKRVALPPAAFSPVWGGRGATNVRDHHYHMA